MTYSAFLLPLETFEHGGGFLEPLLGFGALVVVALALVVGVLLMRRYGLLPTAMGRFGRQESAEQSARQVLAERMARGDLSTEEFLERASVLNWTPGSDPASTRSIRR